jgi:hypothetical protein
MLKRWVEWRWSTRWLVVGTVTVAVALAIAWIVLVPAADWLAHHDVGSVKGQLLQTARDAARGRLLTLGAGLFAAGALLFTARNFILSRENQVTDRYTKAIEQLGSEKLDVRIGGIYALERVARDSKKDHPTAMEVLTAFIREHSHEPWPKPRPSDGPTSDRRTRPDIQAALTVVGRRYVERDRRPIDLAGAYLIRANLTDADLSGALLTSTHFPHANLAGAKLADGHLTGADLTHAQLEGVDFKGAHLTGAHLLALTGANFSGAHLTGAIWSERAYAPDGYVRDPLSGRLKRRQVDSDDSDN